MQALLLAVALVPAALHAAEGPLAPFLGRSIAEIIDAYQDAGVPFAYSTGLVSAELVVQTEPVATEPIAILREILDPHGLTIHTIAGVHLVVRQDRIEPGVADPGATTEPLPTDSGADIESIVVSASRYEISSDIAGSRFQLDQRSIQSMPDIGDDPIRITQRLPGAAASGASARSHFRGGNSDEVGIMLNGQWLFDPFHVRDFQSVFSAIDSRAISGVEVYTGGFPVRYGDRMSGLVLMESVEQEKPRHTELGLSVYNSSFLTSGMSGDKHWLFSARRGNLDLVIDPRFGEPSYYDVFGEFAIELTPHTLFSMNALYANDRVRIVVESDPDELEQVVSRTRNAQVWSRLETQWTDALSSSTVLSATVYDNLRTGSINDPEKMIADVRDERDIDQIALRQDWSFRPSDKHFVQWGLQGSWGDARYDYAGSAQYFGLMALYENQPGSVVRIASAAPNGGNIALYVSDRWRVSSKATVEWGLRWDDQTYNDVRSDPQLSPRINLLIAPDTKTEYRVSWGRYHQSQGIHELQIEDGVTAFRRAERSDHVIAGLRKLIGEHTSLRVEGFYKDISRVRPRFENLYDPLGVIPEFQPDRIAIAPTRARSVGLELSLDQAVGNWDWWASYAVGRATDRIDGRNQSRSWDQRHAFQGGLTWSDDRWTASAAASIHSGWPATDLALVQDGFDASGEPLFVAIPGPRNALQYNTFASVDIRVSRRFDVRRGTLTAFAEISNVLNRRNICCRDWDVTDDVVANLELEHSHDYWLPLLPAVGILWEF